MNKKILAFLIILHIILVVTFMLIFDYQQTSDAPRYIGVANEFASLNFKFSPNLNCNTAPGYPLFLALIKIFTGHNMYIIAIIQSLLFIFSINYFIQQLKKRFKIPNNILLIFFMLMLISPEFINVNGATLTESFAATLMILTCGSLIDSLKNKYDKSILIISFTFLVLTKMEYILILFAIIPYLFLIKKRKPVILLLITLSSALFLNGLKNKQTFGVFNPTSFGSGTVIYGGNNSNLDGSWHKHLENSNYVPKKNELIFDSLNLLNPACSCIKRDSLYKEMAIEAWEINPYGQLKVIPTKFGKQWLLPASFDFYTAQTEYYKGLQLEKLFSDELWPWYGKYKHSIFLSIYWLYLLLSLFGIFQKLKTKGIEKIDLLFFCILLINAAMYSIPFYGLGRFHVPTIALLFYYIIYTIDYLSNKCQLPTTHYK